MTEEMLHDPGPQRIEPPAEAARADKGDRQK
jgi:hypothetical protein